MKIHRLTAFGGAVAIGWTIYGLLGNGIAHLLDSLIGKKLLEKAGGKITDPEVFIRGRFREALLLLTTAWLLWLVVAFLDKLLQRFSVYRDARGIGLGVIGFAALNSWIAIADQTCLFWAPFFTRAYGDNFAQYQIKKALLPEQSAPHNALLIGNSQTNNNLDEEALNRLMAGQLWFTELHQPGASGYDLLMITRNLKQVKAELVVCYISAIYFYGRTTETLAARFWDPGELPFSLRNGRFFHLPDGVLQNGLTGYIFPLYRHRLSFAQRVLGGEVTHLDQRRFDEALTPDLSRQACERASDLQITESSEFEKQAFARAIGELVGADRKLVLIAGQVRPVLEQAMNPAIRPDMLHFLRTLEKEHSGNVTVVEQDEFFTPSNDDFVDLVHFGEPARARMSQRLAEILRQRFLPRQTTENTQSRIITGL